MLNVIRRAAWYLEPLLLAVLLGLVSIVPVAWAIQAPIDVYPMEQVGWHPLGTEQALFLAIGSVVPASLIGGSIGALAWRLRPTVAPVVALSVAWVTGIASLPLAAAATDVPLRSGIACIDACRALLRNDDPLGGLAAYGEFLVTWVFSIPFLVVPASLLLIARRFRHRGLWIAMWLSAHAALHAFVVSTGASTFYWLLMLGVVIWTGWLLGRDAAHPVLGSTRRRWAASVGVGCLVIGLCVGSMWGSWIPSVPVQVHETLVGTAHLSGVNPPDPVEPLTTIAFPPTPSGEGCFGPIFDPVGRLDLCWEGHRDNREVLPGGDIYHFRLIATLQGTTPTTWVAIAIDVPDDERTRIRQFWPEGVLDGPCRVANVDGMNFLTDGSMTTDIAEDLACGRTTAMTKDGRGRHWVTWTCAACGANDPSGRQIALRHLVGTEQGTVPTWDVYAAIGN